MRTRYALIAAFSAAALVVGTLVAFSAPAPKVTGGGQTTDASTTGADDTIAFVAQDTDGSAGKLARGQVQYVDRSGNAAQVVRHGTVTCLVITGNTARLAGYWGEQEDEDTFEIALQDNGQGSESDDDLVEVFTPAEPDCANDDGSGDDPDVALARGNVQIHN